MTTGPAALRAAADDLAPTFGGPYIWVNPDTLAVVDETEMEEGTQEWRTRDWLRALADRLESGDSR